MVGGIQIYLGEMQVGANHLQSGMTEHILQGVGVAAIAEELDGEGVTEAVGVTIGHAGTVADGRELLEQAIPVQGRVQAGGEERVAEIGITAGGKVAPDGLAGASREGQRALFGAFAEDLGALVAQIQVVDLQGAEFGSAHAGIEQKQDDGTVALGVGQAVGRFALARAGVGARSAQGAQQGLDIGLAEGDDDAGFLLGGLDLVQEVISDQVLGECPGPEGGEAGVVVQDGLFRDILSSQEALDGNLVDVGNGGIDAEKGNELAEGIAIIGEGVGAEAASFGRQQVA